MTLNLPDSAPLRTSERGREASLHSVLLRIGLHGQVGRFQTEDALELRRGQRVLCRTNRGLEVGQVLTRANTAWGQTDGRVLRLMQPEDELLFAHLQELGTQAQESCQCWMDEQGYSEVLLDVEPLMDGRTLYFHFLAGVSREIENQVASLAAIYEREVQSSEFANLLEQGCGPGCGTEKAENGCSSSGGCAVCAIAKACGKS